MMRECATQPLVLHCLHTLLICSITCSHTKLDSNQGISGCGALTSQLKLANAGERNRFAPQLCSGHNTPYTKYCWRYQDRQTCSKV